MSSFVYRGLNADGVEVDGRITASDHVDALRQLEAQSIAPFKLDIAREEDRKFDRNKARPQDRFRFMRQLSVLLRAGTPLLDAFDALASEEPCRDLAGQASDVRRALRSGTKLSDAMREGFPELPGYGPRLLELGEATGQLPKALADIAGQMEADLKAQAEIRNALAYPSFLAVAGTSAVIFIFMFVVPRFATLLGDDRSSLPAFSRWVIETGVYMRENWVQVALIGLGAVIVVMALFRNKTFMRSFGDFLHRVPVVGSFLSASEIAKWSRACGTALNGGATLVDALVLAEQAVDSSRRKQGLVEARRAIRAGEPIDQALKAYADFDSMTVNLIRTGRASASLDEMMLFVANMYEEEARNRAKRLTSLAEPLAILFIASVVGMIVVSLVMAMSSLYDVAL